MRTIPDLITAANANPGGATDAETACVQLVALLGRAAARDLLNTMKPANSPSPLPESPTP